MLPLDFCDLSQSFFNYQDYMKCISHLVITNRDVCLSVFPQVKHSDEDSVIHLPPLPRALLSDWADEEPDVAPEQLLHQRSPGGAAQILLQHPSERREWLVQRGKPHTRGHHIRSQRWWFLWISDHWRWRDRSEISGQIVDWRCPGEGFLSFPIRMWPF